jgi:hypothetical protein
MARDHFPHLAKGSKGKSFGQKNHLLQKETQMNDIIEIKVPAIPGIRDIVLREEAFVSLNSASADVRVETVYPLISRIPPPPPQVTSSCDKAPTWTFSGSHMTGANGTVDIHLNKFLDCIPAVIRGVVVGQNDLPAVAGVIYSNYIGSKPTFTATPESEQPVFLTCSIDVVGLQPPQGQVFLPQAWDVTIKVRSWKYDGTPAPKITFNWIAIARTATVTNF